MKPPAEQPQFIRTFLKHGYWGGASVLLKMAGSLAMNKMLVLAFGTAGIAWHAQVLSIFNLFILLPNEGLFRGAIILAKEGKRPVKLAWGLSMLLILLLGIALLCLPDEWLGLPWQYAERLIFTGSVAFFVTHLLLLALLHAGERFQALALLGALGNVLGALLMGGFLLFGASASVALLALPMGLGLSLLAAIGVSKNEIKLLAEGEWLPRMTRSLLAYTLPAMGSLVFSHLLYYLVRSHSLHYWGDAQTGIWQAASTLSSYYTALYIAGPIAVIYPHLLQLKSDPAASLHYISKSARWIVPSIWLGLLLLAIARAPLMQLLFSANLPPQACDALLWQMASDALHLPGFLLAYWLLVHERPMVVLLSHIGTALGYVASAYWALPQWGIVGYAAAHLGGSALGLLVLAAGVMLAKKRVN